MGWIFKVRAEECLEILRLTDPRQWSLGNEVGEEPIRAVQVVASCSGCDADSINRVRAMLSFWNMQVARQEKFREVPSQVTSVFKTRPCNCG